MSGESWYDRNRHQEPLGNFHFLLLVEAVLEVPCKGVNAFERELEYEYLQEGGLNDTVHLLRKPASKPFFLVVERYVGTELLDPLPLGAELTLPLLLIVSQRAGQFFDGTTRAYAFTGCTVTKKEYGALNAEQSGLLTEQTTIAYQEMLCLDA